ncbi:type II CRISPR-associated endonuclease Cas1 [Vagococcus sp. DIV0080]|uniref:CRISPR-associated endonuclease Cas1 n=1 Tax=Candidatus Vagococcus giribetii TaxID=2230876 RepID=A0ABS3HP75_9ENTE|nr:type II CRISPR-associated endonuclease Cas1 [Vagococcus sp. DIV0080]MBO0475542.1 type II CRISPR-associated endonuclease Cas1 [Vagococcus sp. DIV0080]
MGWRTLVVNKHSKISYKNNHLIFKSVEYYEMIHLSELDVLILETTDITMTTMLIKRLIDENVLIIFCDNKRLPIGKVLPFYARHDSSLQLSKQIAWDIDLKAKVWTEIISQKIENQSQFLLICDFEEKSEAINKLLDGLQLFDPTNREGHAARIYFNTLFGNDFNREAENDINAGLNYGYALLLSIFARELVLTGCMTQFGLKHANQFNDFNFASDVMEPFRPIVDTIIYENREESFRVMKKRLFDIFSDTYLYNGKQMFLTNIASDYTKKIIKTLNDEMEGVPKFRI